MDELLEALNNAPKFVASNTLTEPLPWPNSALLDGDVAEAVAKLKIEKGATCRSWAAATSSARSCPMA